jgi:hypothetical protein
VTKYSNIDVQTNSRSNSLYRAAILALVGCAWLLQPSNASAVEGGLYGAPLGGTDVRQAFLPVNSGIYGALIGAGILAPTYQGPDGSSVNAPAHTYTKIIGAGLLFVYPFKPLGFTLGSSIQFNYAFDDQALTVNGVHKSGTASGFMDSFSDLFYASHYLGRLGAVPGGNPKIRYGLTGAFGLAAELPIGSYNASNFVNPARGTYITVPNVALTYDTGPNLSLFDATEISTRFFFDTSARNPADGYQAGNLIDLDFSLTQRTGNFQFGGAGVFAQQITSDHAADYSVVAPFGNKYSKFDLGPVFIYDSPGLDTTFKLKALFPVHHENNYDTTTIVISASRKLY